MKALRCRPSVESRVWEVEPLEPRRLRSVVGLVPTYAVTELTAGLAADAPPVRRGTDVNAGGQVAVELNVTPAGGLFASGPGRLDPGPALTQFAGPGGAGNGRGDGFSSTAAAVNAGGQVAGTAVLTADGHAHAFRSDGGALTDLGTLGGPSSNAYGLNDAGIVVGSADTAAGDSHAFVFVDGRMTDLGAAGGESSTANAVNNRGQIVGSIDARSGATRPFLYADGRLRVLRNVLGGGTGDGDARAINDAGVVVGEAGVGLSSHAFWFDTATGRRVDLGALDDENPRAEVASVAVDVNSAGVAVGQAFPTSPGGGEGFGSAFVYAGGGVTRLDDLLAAAPAGLEVVTAQAITDAGQILASARGGTGGGGTAGDVFNLRPVLLTPQAVTANVFGLAGKGGRQSLRYTDADGTVVTLSLRGGLGAARYDGRSLDVALTSYVDQGGLMLTATAKGGDGRFTLGDVTADGPVRRFAAPAADVTGTFAVTGTLTRAAIGGLTGTLAAAGDIGRLDVGGDLAAARVLAGTDLGSDHQLGGAADRFVAASVGRLTVRGTVAGSIVAAGINPGAGAAYGDLDDRALGGTASAIEFVRVAGGTDALTRLFAGAFGVVRLPKAVDATDARLVQVTPAAAT